MNPAKYPVLFAIMKRSPCKCLHHGQHQNSLLYLSICLGPILCSDKAIKENLAIIFHSQIHTELLAKIRFTCRELLMQVEMILITCMYLDRKTMAMATLNLLLYKRLFPNHLHPCPSAILGNKDVAKEKEEVVSHWQTHILSPASRVGSHNSMAWLRTGVSSGNRPIVGTKNAENTARALEGPCVDRVPRGVLLWSSVGKPGDLGDRPADKISVCLDQGLEIRGSVDRINGILGYRYLLTVSWCHLTVHLLWTSVWFLV